MAVLERLSGPSTLGEAIRRAPIVREVAAEALVLGGATMKLGLSGMEHAMGHVLEAMEASGTPDENGALLQAAAERLSENSPVQVKRSVEEALGVG